MTKGECSSTNNTFNTIYQSESVQNTLLSIEHSRTILTWRHLHTLSTCIRASTSQVEANVNTVNDSTQHDSTQYDSIQLVYVIYYLLILRSQGYFRSDMTAVSILKYLGYIFQDYMLPIPPPPVITIPAVTAERIEGQNSDHDVSIATHDTPSRIPNNDATHTVTTSKDSKGGPKPEKDVKPDKKDTNTRASIRDSKVLGRKSSIANIHTDPPPVPVPEPEVEIIKEITPIPVPSPWQRIHTEIDLLTKEPKINGILKRPLHFEDFKVLLCRILCSSAWIGANNTTNKSNNTDTASNNNDNVYDKDTQPTTSELPTANGLEAGHPAADVVAGISPRPSTDLAENKGNIGTLLSPPIPGVEEVRILLREITVETMVNVINEYMYIQSSIDINKIWVDIQ